MRRHGAEACLFFGQANVRYATGSTIMTVYSMGSCVRCTLVPAEGLPILFEHPNSAHVSRRIVEDVRPMRGWEWTADPTASAAGWAKEIVAALRERGVTSTRLFVDRMGTSGLLALEREGLDLADSGPLTLDAREVKTPEEIRLMEHNAAIGLKMLAAFEAAIAPGVREHDLLAVLTESAGRVVTRGELMAGVWDENWFGSTKTLDVHVSSLRRKLMLRGEPAALITTVRGRGYRFEAGVAG